MYPNVSILKSSFFLLILFLSVQSIAQNLGRGEIHGNFQADVQYYNPDSAIGAPPVPEKVLFNGFGNLIYTMDNFSAGIRYESYLNPLQGFDPRYKGNGIPYRYANYKSDKMDITLGNFYDQFGSGLIFRSYEERNLGYDNAMDGVRVKYMVHEGAFIKAFIGKQRSFFDYGQGIVRGLDGDFQINDIIEKLREKRTKITIGGSFVSKYQPDQDPIYILPENVAASAIRMNIMRGNVSIFTEYVYKINDPSSVNKYIYKPGDAILISTTYSKKGLGLSLAAKRIDNMNFRSDRTASLNNLLINYIPAFTKQHTYSLLAFYPYASQPNGELNYQIEFFYNLKKNSKLGGPYGTDINLNISQANGLDTTNLNDGAEKLILGYKADYFTTGPAYFKDLNIEIIRKINKQMKISLIYSKQFYNKNVIQGLSGYENIKSDIAVAHFTYIFNSAHSIETELQQLSTNQDKGSWAYASLEYHLGSHWFFALLDQYNYGNNNSSERLHYVMGTMGYVKNANRISLSYGKQRSGIFCVGGVCRYVPASNGLALSITSSF